MSHADSQRDFKKTSSHEHKARHPKKASHERKTHHPKTKNPEPIRRAGRVVEEKKAKQSPPQLHRHGHGAESYVPPKKDVQRDKSIEELYPGIASAEVQIMHAMGYYGHPDNPWKSVL